MDTPIYDALTLVRETEQFLQDRETLIAAMCHVLEMDIEDICIKAAYRA